MNAALAGWRPGPGQRRLGPGEVHIWRASLDTSREVFRALNKTLSPDEVERAGRFAFEELREHFTVARGFLRSLLASYLRADPRELCFRYAEHEKPYLAGNPEWETLNFNLAHSHGLALLAVTRGKEIGVDVEWIRSDLEQNEMAARFFSPMESSELAKLPQAEQIRRFFTYWTCKEAYVKAQGGGLSIPLDQFEVRLEEERSAAMIFRVEPAEATSWIVHRLAPGPGFAGALAVDSPSLQLSLWDWKP